MALDEARDEGLDDKLLRRVLRALPFALQGADTDVLAFDSGGGLRLPRGVPIALATALAALAEPCVLYRAIDAHLRRAAPRGLLVQALHSAVRDSLRAYLALISELEQRVLAAPAALGLAAAAALLQAPTLYLRLFRTVLEEAAAGAALDAVFRYTQHGDALVRAHAAELQARVLEPFNALLAQWESRGSLQGDVFHELFVEAAAEHEFRFVDARVPPFLSLAAAQRSFARGKALYFIRVVCGHDDFDGVGRPDAEIMAFTHTLLVHENNLLLHLRGLRDYMLLANGNFVDALFRNDTTSFLMQPLSAVSQYRASEFFIGAIDDLGAEHLEDGRVLRCIDAYILGLDSAASDRLVWEAFVGKYQLDALPLRMVVDDAATRKYQRAFATLWRVRLAVYSLTESSLRLRVLAAQSAQNTQSTQSTRVKHLNDVHMVMNKTFLRLQEHLYYTVVDQHWTRLEATLRGAPQLALADVQAAHARYIDAISAVVALPSNVQAVQTMTRLALGLQRILEEQELELAQGAPADDATPPVAELADAFEQVAYTLVLPL